MTVQQKSDVKEDREENVPAPHKDEPAAESWGWTRQQRIGLGILVGLLVLFLAVQYWRRPHRLGDGVKVENSDVVLPQRLDPNIATAQELARIPHVGEATAAKIVAYRDTRKATAPDGVVFRHAEDLDAVPGVGKKLIEQLEPFLAFPESP